MSALTLETHPSATAKPPTHTAAPADAPLGRPSASHVCSRAMEDVKRLYDGLEAKRTIRGIGRSFLGWIREVTRGDSSGRRASAVWRCALSGGSRGQDGEQFIHTDTTAFAPTTRVNYAYVHRSDYCGDSGAYAFGAVFLRPSAVPALTCAELLSKRRAVMKLPSKTMDTDRNYGVLMAEERDQKGKGERHAGTARRLGGGG
ncbi:hypothetical protein B0H11DRAFT_2430475 [Mycena galericulata]|nr:hypothetical protein B0H11DRAFT_2430475 [Mycena galericulata]